MKNILFVASEGVPFIKTGGLADVVGSLPKYVDKEYFDVRVMLPKYMCMSQALRDKMTYKTHFYMDFNWKNEYVGILEAVEDGVSGFISKVKDKDSLYETIKKFIELPYERKKQMGLAGRGRMKAMFDKNMVVDMTTKNLNL